MSGKYGSIAVVVTSDSVYRGEKEDRVTLLVRGFAERNGLNLAYAAVVPNDAKRIEEAVLEAVERAGVVFVTGGTGVSPHDITVDVVERLASKELPGFGERHRMVSYEKIGPRALLSRATAFIVRGSFVAVTPGNPDAVKTAIDIVEGFLGHLIEQLQGRKH
ncbi:MogA/MoaB family molybdenum cofactor biosynthesis protein [Stetteria hydrogenophila]